MNLVCARTERHIGYSASGAPELGFVVAGGYVNRFNRLDRRNQGVRKLSSMPSICTLFEK